MLRIGYHVSGSGGYVAMGRETTEVGGNTFAFFTRNPRGGQAKPIDRDDINAFIGYAAEHDINNIVAHSAYTLNPCSADEKLRVFARNTMADDLVRMEYTPGNYYNFHPGSHTGQGIDVGIAQIADLLNAVIRPDQHTTVLLETMSGKGSEVGSRFEEIRRIIDMVGCDDHVGVCLDTCHIWDAGYDVVGDFDSVMTEFDKVIGLNRLKAIHLNDSMNDRASHKDRHAKIGEGRIGYDALARIVNHAALHGLPFILETPNDTDGYRKEIEMMRAAYRN